MFYYIFSRIVWRFIFRLLGGFFPYAAYILLRALRASLPFAVFGAFDKGKYICRVVRVELTKVKWYSSPYDKGIAFMAGGHYHWPKVRLR